MGGSITRWVSLPSLFRYPPLTILGGLGTFRVPHPHLSLGGFLAENGVGVAGPGSSRAPDSGSTNLHGWPVFFLVLIARAKNRLQRNSLFQFKNPFVLAPFIGGLRVRQAFVGIGDVGLTAVGAVSPQIGTQMTNRPFYSRLTQFGILHHGLDGRGAGSFLPPCVTAYSEQDHHLVRSKGSSDVVPERGVWLRALARHGFGSRRFSLRYHHRKGTKREMALQQPVWYILRFGTEKGA